MRLTLNKVNAELRKLSGDDTTELVHDRAKGYFYFYGDTESSWPSQGVYGVARLNDLSMERWVAEYIELRDAANNI